MKRSRFTLQQILKILKEYDSGSSVIEVCTRYGISSSTVYAWKARYEQHIDAADLTMTNLAVENRRLKQRLEDMRVDYEALKGEIRRLRDADAAF